jgi:hypothetical protein
MKYILPNPKAWYMTSKKKPVTQVSESRKNTYLLGQIILGIGVLLFLSNFVIFGASFGDFSNFAGKIRQQMGLAFGGMICIVIGAFLMKLGKYGKAGAGFTLDPEQERLDKEPINRSIGGQLSDILDEAGINKAGGSKEIIKIRCTHCQYLNDEADKFCGGCGKSLTF